MLILMLGTPQFPVASLMTRHCCSPKAFTCFKLLAQSTIEYIRLSIYSVSEIEQTQVVVNYMVQHSQGDRHVLYTVAGG